MTRTSTLWTLTTIAMTAAACTAMAAETKGRPDRGAEREALLRTDRQFSERSAAKGLTDAFLAYMAEGATMLPPNGGPVTGREAIRELLGDGGGVLLTWTPMHAEVADSGEIGYTWGMSEWRVPGPEGPTLARKGKYVTIWRKQSDGTWKFVLDCGNSAPVTPPDAKPAPPPPPAAAPAPPDPPPAPASPPQPSSSALTPISIIPVRFRVPPEITVLSVGPGRGSRS